MNNLTYGFRTSLFIFAPPFCVRGGISCMTNQWLYKLSVTLFLIAGFALIQPVKATSADTSANKNKKENYGFNPGDVIIEHISDSHEWHFFDYKFSDGTVLHASICLPVILYAPGAGLSIFSFKQLHHGPYDGYTLNEDHITRTDGGKFYDFSITKNVFQEIIAVLLMLLIFISAARSYRKSKEVKAPRGLASAVEVIVNFIRDEVAKPMLGKKYDKYLPFLLTVFFFIWINNLLGLVPGAANVTGNIAVTMTLALFTFILILTGSKRSYWSHLANPPGVPLGVKFILVPIEFISDMIVKPGALMIRLFANMLAGHLIVLSFLCMIFIFASITLAAGLGTTIFSIGFSIFIYFLELLVAALQAYIFTMLSALFIGDAIVAHHHEEEPLP